MKLNLIDKLNTLLPKIEKTILSKEVDVYGFSDYIKKKSNLKNISIKTHVTMRHGWLHQKEFISEEEITHGVTSVKNLVATEKEVKYLNKFGNYSAKAIGSTYIYIDKKDLSNVQRIKNSLLVMPPHSHQKTTENWKEEEYIKYILKIREDFDVIIFCIHQYCLEKNYWIETLKKYNFDWIIGSALDDKNSLLRMAKIFNSFEYVTSCSFGSHVAYASYSGCKVSIYGKYQYLKKENFTNVPLYKDYPELLDKLLNDFSEEYIKKHYGFFFTNPKDAKTNIEWAKEELGEKYKLSYKELAKLMDLTTNYSTNQFDFALAFSRITNYLHDLSKMNKSFILYGNGYIGQYIKSIMKEKILGTVDKSSNISIEKEGVNRDIVYNPEKLSNISFDYIIISVLGREESISNYLTDILNIEQKRIIILSTVKDLPTAEEEEIRSFQE